MKVALAALLLGSAACTAPESLQPTSEVEAWASYGSPDPSVVANYVGCYRFSLPPGVAPDWLPPGPVIVRLTPEVTGNMGAHKMVSHPRTRYETQWLVRGRTAYAEWGSGHHTALQIFLEKQGSTASAWAYQSSGIRRQRVSAPVVDAPCAP